MNKDYQSQKELEKVFEEYTSLISRASDLFKVRNEHHKNKFLKRGLGGIIVRIEDKLGDVESGGKEGESLTECLLDIANYAIMGTIIVERKNKKDAKFSKKASR